MCVALDMKPVRCGLGARMCMPISVCMNVYWVRVCAWMCALCVPVHCTRLEGVRASTPTNNYVDRLR